MDFFKLIDPGLAQAIALGMVGGLIAASLRAFQAQDSPKAFIIRLITGCLTAAFLVFILYDFSLPRWAIGAIIFAAGWASAEIGAMLANAGIERAKDALGIDKDKTDETTT